MLDWERLTVDVLTSLLARGKPPVQSHSRPKWPSLDNVGESLNASKMFTFVLRKAFCPIIKTRP